MSALSQLASSVSSEATVGAEEAVKEMLVSIYCVVTK